MGGLTSHGWRAFLASLALALGAAGCGGGGGSTSTTGTLPTLVQDDFPAGPRSPAPAGLFALSAGDTAVFRKLNAGGVQIDTVQRVATAGPRGPGHLIVSQTDRSGTESADYIRDAAGLSLDFSGDTALPPAARSIMGTLIEYPDPLYPVGSTRSSFRQGAWGQDLNGDGLSESFQFRFTQVFQGFETMTFYGKALSVARFTNIIDLSIVSSRSSDGTGRAVSIEENYFAEGFGLVHQVVRMTDGNGNDVEPPYTLELRDATIGGRSWQDHLLNDGTRVQLDLVHVEAVYDPIRHVYYATVPSTYRDESGLMTLLPPGANGIATVDADTGSVTYSAPVGANPTTLAIASDGSALYVGLLDAPEVVRVALPSMVVSDRLALTDGAPTHLPQYARHIQASPTHATTFALSMGYHSWDRYSSNRSVALVRNMVIQPDQITAPPRANVITFAPAGSTVFGVDFDSSPATASSFQVTPGGLSPLASQALGTHIGVPNGIWMDHVADSLVLGRFAVSTTTLAVTDMAPGLDCRALTGTKAVCLRFPTYADGSVVAKALVPITLPANAADALISFGAHDGSSKVRISSAVPGRVAVSEARGALTRDSPFTRMILFSSPRLN